MSSECSKCFYYSNQSVVAMMLLTVWQCSGNGMELLMGQLDAGLLLKPSS